MRYRVEWFYELIGEWMLYDSYLFRRRAVAVAGRKIVDPLTSRRWRVWDGKSGALVVHMIKPSMLDESRGVRFQNED